MRRSGNYKEGEKNTSRSEAACILLKQLAVLINYFAGVAAGVAVESTGAGVAAAVESTGAGVGAGASTGAVTAVESVLVSVVSVEPQQEAAKKPRDKATTANFKVFICLNF